MARVVNRNATDCSKLLDSNELRLSFAVGSPSGTTAFTISSGVLFRYSRA